MDSGYSGTPLPKKLGIREGTRVALVAAPKGFSDLLGALPLRAKVTRSGSGEADVILLFVTRVAALLDAFPAAAARMPGGGGMLWVAWPKKGSATATDLSFDVVQKLGLDAGLVDTKICAINATWSGLRFSRRRT
ncbi:MAG: DUF3052 domain-containing protein [Gemmatimonadaceae bacterium]|nr:DUF3052 domain-containing protein [Gemmatimonadaceae bacterium]